MPDLITLSDRGFYCPAGDFHIDPWQPVPRAVVTHAHADHYARGCSAYLISAEGETVFRARLGHDAPLQITPYGVAVTINGVRVSLHPAGHILGSAQVRVEHAGEVWVISGDYKTTPDDHTCTSFEAVRCDTFITEATFALPIYHWRPQSEVFADINGWWRANRDAGRATIIYAYALGKAQRVLAGLDADIAPVFTHGAVERITEAYRAAGVSLPPTSHVARHIEAAGKPNWAGALIIAPLSARGTPWTRKFGDYASAFVSGWMQVRGARRRRAVDRGFVLSDHADWDGLKGAIDAAGAARVGVTHGYVAAFVRWLREAGIDARGYDTRFSGENEDNDEGGE